ncbi:MAG: TetR/AcrR family transcriptional regulator, partial [Phormidesmis sp. CAN_BIN36]|nr:TetR/AcrR family transcriptional regulator [Phormidesmis sp. CAN_BIN36]
MSKDSAIPELVKVFRQYGYEGATLAKLSEATGLGKASLYHHFPKGKEEMASAVLDYLNRGLQEQILAPLRS